MVSFYVYYVFNYIRQLSLQFLFLGSIIGPGKKCWVHRSHQFFVDFAFQLYEGVSFSNQDRPRG